MTDLAAKLFAEIRALATYWTMRPWAGEEPVKDIVTLARAVLAMTEAVEALDDYVEHSAPTENPRRVRMLRALDALERALSPNPPK